MQNITFNTNLSRYTFETKNGFVQNSEGRPVDMGLGVRC